MSELAKILEEEELEEEQEDEEVAVLDDASAEMLLDRIEWANRQYEKTEAWYAKQLEKAAAKRDRIVAWSERGLRSYFEMIPDSVKKKAKTQISYELQGGKLVMKNQQPKYDTDDGKLVPWLKQNGLVGLINVKETANWAELKKMLKESPDGTAMVTDDGELVPGVTVEQRLPKFEVKPSKKKE